jgi:2'-hydroxyisoflavone reductase
MRILILGGGVFLGRELLDAALRRGHVVSVFNRGRSRELWPAGAEVLIGDRRRDPNALAGSGPWDAVIDTCGYCQADVQPTAEALAACPRYLFVSSISAYASHAKPGLVEADALASAEGIAGDAEITGENYGPLKAECERVLARSLGERLLIVRPGLIVGPCDPTGRFSYWPWRAVAGGTMLVPGAPPSARLQFIDVRDLSDWMLRLLESGATGCFNATGPAGSDEVGWPGLIAACRRAAAEAGCAPAEPVAVSERLLRQQGVGPWRELPLWLPSDDPKLAGFMAVNVDRAVAHGLRTRTLDQTVRAVLAEPLPAAGDPRRAGKLTPEREAELIALAAR